MKLTHACSIVALSLASVAFAQQDGTFPPEGGREGGRPQQGERPARPAIDPAQAIERLMQNDANGDGQLSKDELPPALADRMLERNDANKDGVLDRSELEAAAKSGALGGGRGGRGAPTEGGARGEGGPRGAMDPDAAMRQVNRAYTTLGSSNFDAESRAADLGNVQMLQGAILAVKSGAARLQMSDTAKARFGDDRTRFETEFRTMTLDMLVASIEVEKAVLAGDAAAAKASLARLEAMEAKSRELMPPSERDGAEAPARPTRPEGGGRQGRGQPGGGLGTGRPPRNAPTGN